MTGAILGYAIGHGFMATLGQPIVDFYHAQHYWDQVVELYNGTWGVWFLAGAAFTPIPYKVATIAAGATDMPFVPFLLVSALGRGARFFLVAGILQGLRGSGAPHAGEALRPGRPPLPGAPRRRLPGDQAPLRAPRKATTMGRRLLLTALLVAGTACSAKAPPHGVPAGPEPSKAVRWVRNSTEYRALVLQVYRAATAHVETAATSRVDGTWGIVADADETLIDNSLYQVEREQQGLGFTPESWHAWTERREAVPLPGAKELLARVRALGGRIAVVTNRRESECLDTEAVLQEHGLVYDVILCRADDGPSDKKPRFDAVVEGRTPAGLPPLEIVAVLGDNIRDFPGLSQALREEDADAFADFGARFFVLPNPMYGSWE